MANSADFFLALADGRRLWFPVQGTSMFPYLATGDHIHAERRTSPRFERGDIAMLKRGDGQLIAHLVSSADPLATTSLMGVLDAPGLVPVGVVVDVRKFGRVHAVTPGLRKVLIALHRVLSSKSGRALAVGLRNGLMGPATAFLRQVWLHPGPPRIPLSEEWASAWRYFCDHGGRAEEQVFRESLTVVAFGARGPLCAAVVLGHHVWVATARRAQALGLERPTLSELLFEAGVRGVTELRLSSRDEAWQEAALTAGMTFEGDAWQWKAPAGH